ncbi:UDP-2,3-diacylglucosamine diphosphatase [Salinisphaera sp. Q1T1-3]|nr:UDP-2,3-diacylglucosamine diphosphatase [Salinisphaera sp. Q1T1-3]
MAHCLAGYLAGPARQAVALYILGDLFDVWIGDDDGLNTHAATLAALANLTATRVPVYFQRGNRDFAVGRAFFERTGLRPLADPVVHRIAGQPTLLAHGDVFCTDDAAHQRFRKRYTNPRWRARMLKLPLAVRRIAARRARARSQQAKTHKAPAIMDVAHDSVRGLAAEFDARRIIHGHTHRPADHDDDGLRRHVLADWRDDQAEVLTVSRRGVRRMALDPNGRFACT